MMDENKIRLAMERVEELYNSTNGKCYLSFSGGKDSTVILAIIKMCQELGTVGDIPAVYCETGLELGATREFVNWVEENWYHNVVRIKPEKPFAYVIKHYGKPIKSKMKSSRLGRLQRNRDETNLNFKELLGGDDAKSYCKVKIANKDLHMIHPNFDIKASDKCCDILKKKPFVKYSKEFDIEGYILGERMAEGGVRQLAAEKRMLNGGKVCTKTKGKYKIKLPIIDWTDEDVEQFIEEYNVPLSKAYTEQGYIRTGCFLCPYSLEIEKNMKKLYDYEPVRYKATLHLMKDVLIAQNVKIPFDEEYEAERKEAWLKPGGYFDMRKEMLEKYRPQSLRVGLRDKDRFK